MIGEQKRYTEQEIERAISHLEKDENDTLLDVFVINNNPVELRTSDLVAMLRQGHDAEEELLKTQREWLSPESWKTLFEDCTSKVKEIDKLKAQLEAIQKSLDDHQDCHKCKSYPHCDGSGCICAVVEITNILRAARANPQREGESK